MGKFLLTGMLVSASIAWGQAGNGNSSTVGNKSKGEIKAKGCVAKQSTDYLLIQADQGNSYELQGSNKVRLKHYLGQEVEVTGVESPSMPTSSDYLARSGDATSVTITVHTIKTIQERCSGN